MQTHDNPRSPAEILTDSKPLERTHVEPEVRQPRFRPVGKRVAVRAVGFSLEDEQKLKQLTMLLSDGVDGAPSVSLVVRKSLEVYLLKILGMQKNDPSTLAHEVSALHMKAKKLCRGKRRQSHHQ
jgi:hypothetical protein